MKYTIISVLCILSLCGGCTKFNSEAVSPSLKYREAVTGTLDITVVDEKGTPVEEVLAKAESWYSIGSIFSNNALPDYADKTDANGHVVLPSQTDTHFLFEKEGYYTSRGRHNVTSGLFGGYEWPPCKEEIVLKAIRNPIPMYACQFNRYGYKIPALNQEFPFDLQKMDWCKPHGKGIRDDVYIHVSGGLKKENDLVAPVKVTLTFKHKDEGLYRAKCDLQSQFKTAHHVITHSTFHNQMTFLIDTSHLSLIGAVDQYLVFRIRCKYNEDGKLITAYYGKICNPFFASSNKTFGGLSVYFNPTPNDTNLEYDPEQNLYKGDTYEEKRRGEVISP